MIFYKPEFSIYCDIQRGPEVDIQLLNYFCML